MKIALTGGIAQGKSTVLESLREAGVRVDSADELARQCFDDPANAASLSEAAGLPEPIDRGALRRLIGSNTEVRRRVNAILHPCILNRIRQSGAQVIEVPLLIEAAIMSEFDAIWCVTCRPEEQLRRLTERLGSREEAEKMISVQLSSRVKEAFADEIIRTDEPLDSVFRETRKTARRWSLEGLRA